MMTNPNNPAFPGAINKNLTGLTKREYFAALALEGLLAHEGTEMEATAKQAVKLADQLIESLKTETNK